MSQTQADMGEPGHSAATDKQSSQNTEPPQTTQHGRDHVPQASNEADPSSSDKAAFDSDADDLHSHKLGVAVADPAQDDSIGAE